MKIHVVKEYIKNRSNNNKMRTDYFFIDTKKIKEKL